MISFPPIPQRAVACVVGLLVFASLSAWGQLVPVGQRVIWEKDLEMSVGAKKACHLEFILRNSGKSEVTVEDFSINGVASDQLPTEKVSTIEDTRWWSAWPNPVAPGAMTSFKLRLVDGPATLGGEGKAGEIVLKTSAGEVKVPFKAAPSAVWMPFVYFAEGLDEMTVYVGNRGKAALPFAADRFLTVNGSPVKATAPAASIAAGEVVPLNVKLAAPLQAGSLVVIQAASGAQSVTASLRALPSSFGSTYWYQVRDFDPVDLAAHHVRTDIPGSGVFLDEPFGARTTPMAFRDKAQKAWDADPARPLMVQKTACQEVQIYAGLPDIVMTHHQWDNRDLELAGQLNWPRPVWYLPQNAWARTESLSRHYRENYYPLADLDREAYEALAHGAKHIQWFSMQTLWWQDAQRAGGTDIARTESSIYFPGALANPAIWDRTGRMNGLMAALSGYLANSTPVFKNKIPPGIQVSTLATDRAENAVIVAIDAATDLNAFYKASGGTKEKLKEFDNLKLTAQIPSYLTANTAFLVDPYAGVSSLPFARSGNTFTTTLPKFQVGAVIVLGTAQDAPKLAAAWKDASAPFAQYADAPGSGLVKPENVTYPKWQHPWPGDERSRDLAVSGDGSRVLVARGPQVICFDADGKTLWTKSYPGEVLAAKFGGNGRIYVAANLNPNEGWNWTNTHILALDPDGSELWKYKVGGTIFDIETGYADGGVAYGTWDKIEKLDPAGQSAWTMGAGFRAFDLSSDRDGKTYFSDLTHHRILDSGGQEIRKWREPVAPPHEPNLTLAASPDGSRVARGGYKFFLYDESGNPLVEDYIGRTVRLVAFSADSSAVAAATADGALRIYDAQGSKLADERMPGSIVSDIRPAGDGRFAVMREIFSYDPDTGWRFRDSTEILNKDGKRSATFEGPWRTNPWMGKIGASNDGGVVVVSENEGVRSYNSSDPAKPNTAIFDGSMNAPLPEGWSAQDFGEPRIAGAARYYPFDDSWVLNASGKQWDRLPSSGFFAGTAVGSSNFTLTVRVRSLAGGAAYRGGGILVASSLNPSDTLAAFFLQPTQKTNRVYYRAKEGANYLSIQGKPANPYEWLRVQRDGDTLRFSISKTGEEWEQLGDDIQIPLGPDSRVGLVATADTENGTVEAVFDNVKLEKQ